VDRLSLGERLRGLDPGQRELFASRFASQLACVAARVEEARACERWLCAEGSAAALEEVLVSALPVPEGTPWLTPGTGTAPPPAELFAHTTLGEIQQLAALAALRTGVFEPPLLEFVRDLAESDDPLSLEAALLVSGWRARAIRWRDDGRRRGERLGKLKAALEVPALAAEAAVCLALEAQDRWRSRLEEDAVPRLRPLLQDALGAPQADIRFGAALALADEGCLGQLLSQAPPPLVRDAALTALARVQSAQVPTLLLGGEDEVRTVLLAGLSTPLSEAILGAVLALLEKTGGALRGRALRLAKDERFLKLSPQSRELVARWISDHVGALSAQEALGFLHWAAEPLDGAQANPFTLRPFVDAVTRSLHATAALEASAAELLRASGFDTWLRSVRTEEDQVVLDRLAAAAATSRALFEALLYLHARESEAAPAEQSAALAHLLALWERAGAARGGWLPTLARAIRDHRGLRGIEVLVPTFWARFRAHAPERAQIVQALEGLQRELFELRDGEPKETALDGGDPVRFFGLWADAAPRELRGTFEAALARGGEGALLPLSQAALARGLEAARARPKTALLLFARVSQEVCNAFRNERSEETVAAVAALREGWRALEPALADAAPDAESERDFDYLRGHVTEALELISRHEREQAERAAEQAKRARERAEAEAERAREAAARKAEEAHRAAQLEALRRKLESEREAAEAARQERLGHEASPTASGGEGVAHLEPDLAAIPLDDEPLGAAPLPTLRDYVRFMKRLSTGSDAMLLFQAYGMEPASWAACASGWQKVFLSRQDAMLRFAALLQATWSEVAPAAQ
jgi:hypothetical protein